MKILLVIDTLASGGAQRQLVNLAKGLKNRGNNVEIFIFNTSYNFFENELIESKIKISYPKLNQKSNKIIRSNIIIKNLKLKLREDFDHLISFLHTPSIYSSIASLYFPKINLVVCERSSSNAPVNLLIKLFFYFACLVSNKVIANSISEKNKIKRRIGLSNKTKAIWNGYKLSIANPKSNKFKLNNKTLTVIGRVAYPKNGINLIRALKLFFKRNGWTPTINWVGRKENDKLSLKMQFGIDKILQDDINISSKWNYLGEIKNINKIFYKTDAIIHPSIYEGLPNVVCESMLSGCVVIASNVSDIPILLDDGRGIIFDSSSPKSICLAIEKFYDMDGVEKQLMKKKAREFANDNFDINNMIDSYEKILFR
tara:strand:- start:82 stop:1191 length:1110 start_codon:yes stop_codon:yes gene_type:complete